MILYLLKKNQLDKLVLPEKVYGSYPIVDEDNVIANVEAEDGKWILKKNANIHVLENGSELSDTPLKNFSKYTIKRTMKTEDLDIIPTPMYDTNLKKYVCKKQSITIGKSKESDICFNGDGIADVHITLTKNNIFWNAVTDKEKTYLCGKSFKKRNMFQGDYLFVNGLKIIIINDIFIINNPNGLVNVSMSAFDNYPDIQPSVTEQEEIPDDIPRYTKDDYFYKAPRFTSVIEPASVKIDAPPQKEKEPETSLLLTVGPRLTMSIMSLYTLYNTLDTYMRGDADFKRIFPSLLSVGLMMVSSFLWPTLTNRYTKKKRKEKEQLRQKKYKEYLNSKEKEIQGIKANQKQILVENNVSLEDCQSIIYNKRRNLWERNIEHEDFLSVRLGVGTVDCQITVGDPSDNFTLEDIDNLKADLDNVLKDAKKIEAAPMNVSLSDKCAMGIVGSSLLTKYFMDSIFLQLLTFHSYVELKIVVCTNKQNEYLWEYLKVAPHSWNNHKTSRYFASDLDEFNLVSLEIEKEFDNRRVDDESVQLEDDGEDSKTKRYVKYKPYYLIFVDDLEIARNNSLIRKILTYKQNLGFSVIIRNDRLSNLPSECSTFINVDENMSGLFENNLISNNQKQFKAELNTSIDMYGCCEKLANIPIKVAAAKGEMPSSVSFLQMYNVGKVEQLNSLDRWKKNNPVTSLSVPIGINGDGQLFKMDAHEKGFGPHGLVAGMTGSGKSEWIVTYILSLAVNFHPDEVQFVLIDYKGGGLALSFENKEMGVKLPHLAGTITNLDKSAINRALTSIEAELKRRQSLFNEAREKLHESSINIYKYQQYYRKGMLDEPLSHLFIISDEFAELKSQQPEFLDQLVSTARIGRSLGVHLILATQKPSGVVNDQIWSNSRFHVCLRVQDKSDSQEMIKCPDAAMLKTTGTFYLQVGYNEYFELGQGAWAGAKYYPSDIVKKSVDQSVQYIDNLGKTINSFDEDIFEEKEEVKNEGEELLNIVSYISKISKEEPIKARQLWLENIPTEIYLNDIKSKYNHKSERYNFEIVVGEYDNPALQSQDVLKVDLSNNTAIYGEGGAGKENFITTLLWSCMMEHTPQEVNFYIFDFGAETLKMFTKFPHVGEVVTQEDTENALGVLQLIAEEMEKRKEMFAEYNGTYEGYLKESGKTLPRWQIVINAFDIFQEAFPRLVDLVNNMFRDSDKYGIEFIVSTSTTTAIRAKSTAYFKNKIVLHMADDGQYRNITNCDKKLIPGNNFGRGIANIDDGVYCEFQTAFVAPQSQINQFIRKNADYLSSYYKSRAKSLPKMPEEVSSSQLIQYVTDLENVPVGYDFHEKTLAKYNYIKDKLSMMSIENISSNVDKIVGLTNVLSKVPGVKVRIVDFLGIYPENVIDIKLFNDNFDPVIVALNDDVKTRTAQQDYGITFILGAGIMKSKLTNFGKDTLNEYLTNVSKATNSTIILVDSYDKLKTLKIEPWFASINNTHGLWIGGNVHSQNLFSVGDISMDDRKLDYPGIGFIINDSSYQVIKVVSDMEEE